jgi:hypothetical protein
MSLFSSFSADSAVDAPSRPSNRVFFVSGYVAFKKDEQLRLSIQYSVHTNNVVAN